MQREMKISCEKRDGYPFCWKLAAHISCETMIGQKIEIVFVYIIYFLNFPFQATEYLIEHPDWRETFPRKQPRVFKRAGMEDGKGADCGYEFLGTTFMNNFFLFFRYVLSQKVVHKGCAKNLITFMQNTI